MTAYLIRRAGTSLVILIGISIFVYVLLHAVFPSPAIVILGPKASPAAFTTYAMPDYLLYLVAIQVFAISIPIFSFEASQSTSIVTVIGDWREMTLPILCIALLVLAGYSRYMRSAAMETWPRTTSRRPGPRGCRSGSCCSGTCSATPACR